MIFDLVKDFAEVLAAMPEEHPRQRILKLLDEAIRWDVHFIDRHPTTFFQCMWNACWWYDCEELKYHHPQSVLDQRRADEREPRLSQILERWRTEKESTVPGFRWVRSLLPPAERLGSAIDWQLSVGDLDDVYLGRTVVSAEGSRIVCWGVRLAATEQEKSSAGVTILDSQTGQPVNSVRLDPNGYNDVATHCDVDFAVVALKGEQTVSGDGRSRDQVVPKGRSLASIDARTGTLTTMFGKDYAYKAIALSPDGQYLAALTFDRNPQCVDVWDLRDMSLDVWYDQSRGIGEVSSFCWTRNGMRLIEKMRLRDRSDKLQDYFRILDPQNDAVLCTADDFVISTPVTGNFLGELLLWLLAVPVSMLRGGTLNGTRQHLREAGEPATAPLMSPLIDQVAIAYKSGFVQMWTVKGRKSGRLDKGSERFEKTYSPRQCLAFSPDGSLLVDCRFVDGEADVWNVRKRRRLKHVSLGSDHHISELAVLPDNRRMLTWSSAQNSLRMRSLEKSGESDHISSRLIRLNLSPDGRFIAPDHNDELIRVWDAKTGRRLKAWNLTTGEIFDPTEFGVPSQSRFGNPCSSCHFVPETDLIIVTSTAMPGDAWLLSMATGKSTRIVIGSTATQPYITTSSTGRYFVHDSDLWSLDSLQVVHRFAGTPMCFSADDSLLTTAEGTIGPGVVVHLWDTATGRELQQWETEAALIRVFFARSHSLIMITDSSIRRFDLSSGRQLSCSRMKRATVRDLDWRECQLLENETGFIVRQRRTDEQRTNHVVFCDITGKPRRTIPVISDLEVLADSADRPVVLICSAPIMGGLGNRSRIVTQELETVAEIREEIRHVTTCEDKQTWYGTDAMQTKLVAIRLEGDVADLAG